jgi:hypothetical protein
MDIVPELADAPKVLAVGDIHLENFGTWRDADGRLVWGVNDYDEAADMPYTLDLLRLTKVLYWPVLTQTSSRYRQSRRQFCPAIAKRCPGRDPSYWIVTSLGCGRR